MSAPGATALSRPYLEGLALGELRFQRCTACGRAQRLARHACAWCGAPEPRWQSAAGTGTVFALTEVRRAPTDTFRALVPYTLVLVDLVYMPHPAELAERFDLLTADFTYARLIGDRKKIDALTDTLDHVVLDQSERLEEWAGLVRELMARAKDVYVYANNHYAGFAPDTIRDLVGVDFDPTTDFPSDEIGHGFDTIGDVLTLSPLLLERVVLVCTNLHRAVHVCLLGGFVWHMVKGAVYARDGDTQRDGVLLWGVGGIAMGDRGK